MGKLPETQRSADTKGSSADNAGAVPSSMGDTSSALAVRNNSGDSAEGIMVNGALAMRPEDQGDQRLWDWLAAMDGGKGAMLQYFGPIKSEFDADFSQIVASRLAQPISAGVLGSIEPSFFEVLDMKPVGHRLLFARAINALSV